MAIRPTEAQHYIRKCAFDSVNGRVADMDLGQGRKPVASSFTAPGNSSSYSPTPCLARTFSSTYIMTFN
jgi:hypothetical protein